MATITSVIQQKGGVGKSTTAQAIGAYYAAKGQHVLLVDLDSQRNLTLATGKDGDLSSYDMLISLDKTAAAIVTVKDNLDLIPADARLAGIDAALSEVKVGKEYRLREAFSTIAGRYDHIVIDTPPALSLLTINALTVSDRIVVPAQADVFSLAAIQDLAGTIETVRRYTNPRLVVSGILLTRYNMRPRLTKDLTVLMQKMAAALGTKVYDTKIREAVAIREAQALKQDIFTYALDSKVAGDYRAFCAELDADTGK